MLHPSDSSPLPATIDHTISPITSRAHPSIAHLSCALIHPSEPSCFSAYLTHNLVSFPQLARFFAIYYSALALLRYKQLLASPTTFINALSTQVLKTTMAISGAIGASWGSICLFAAIFPRSFLPQYRFFLGGLLGGCFQIFDRGPMGKANALYASRMSADSLWKVGIKRGWWQGVQGGDVWIFVAGLALLSCVYEIRQGAIDSGAVQGAIKALKGELDLDVPQRPAKPVERNMRDETTL